MENTVENNKIIELINQIDADSQITNELIAEFMGWSIQKDPTERFFGHYFTPERIKHEKLFFDTDWNYLMPIVRKIEAIENIYEIEEFLLIRDELCTGRIETSYQAVINFIEWYNENIQLIHKKPINKKDHGKFNRPI